MKYDFSLDLKVDWLKMSNASLVVDEIDDHSAGKWTKKAVFIWIRFRRNVLFKIERFLSGVNTSPAKVKETSIN